jgi:hypothetical protein
MPGNPQISPWQRGCTAPWQEVIIMKLSIVSPASLVAYATAGLVTLAPGLALADADATPSVSCVSGQFGDHVDQGRATGDSSAIFAAKKAVYWVDISNPGEPTAVTLVWTLDGHEVQRQSLDVGRSPHWHTWGTRPLGGAHKVDVEVLDAAGHSLKTDSLTSS